MNPFNYPHRPVNENCVLPQLLATLFDSYSPDQLHEILLNTLYMAVSNPSQNITRQELFDSVQAITQLNEFFRKAEKNLPSCL